MWALILLYLNSRAADPELPSGEGNEAASKVLPPEAVFIALPASFVVAASPGRSEIHGASRHRYRSIANRPSGFFRVARDGRRSGSVNTPSGSLPAYMLRWRRAPRDVLRSRSVRKRPVQHSCQVQQHRLAEYAGSQRSCTGHQRELLVQQHQPASLCGHRRRRAITWRSTSLLGFATPNGHPNGKALTAGNVAPADAQRSLSDRSHSFGNGRRVVQSNEPPDTWPLLATGDMCRIRKCERIGRLLNYYYRNAA